jgi:hypothetical protein
LITIFNKLLLLDATKDYFGGEGELKSNVQQQQVPMGIEQVVFWG